MAGIAPSDAEVIRGAIRAQLAEVFTATIGEVQAYDSLTQTADVLPVMKRAFNIGDGVVDFEDLPVISNVPIYQPRAGGFFIHMPVTAGDHVLLVFTHDDIANWRETGTASEPDDLRRHSLGSCIGITGAAHMLEALTATNPLELAARLAGFVLGEDGTDRQAQWTEDGWIQFGGIVPAITPPPAMSPVALGISTQVQINALQTEIAALQTEIALVQTAVAAIQVTITAISAIPIVLGPAIVALPSLAAGVAAVGAATTGVATAAAAVATGTAALAAAAPTAQSTLVRTK